jgi:hypothetical protein
VNKSCASCRGAGKWTKGRNIKWLEGQGNIRFRSNKLQQDQEEEKTLRFSTNKPRSYYIYEINIIVKRLLVVDGVVVVVARFIVVIIHVVSLVES